MVKKNKNQPKQAPKKAAPKKAAAKRSRKPNNSRGAGGLSITSVNEGVGFKIKPFTQQDSTIEGCDYLHTIIINAGDAATTNSAVIYSVPINPLSINTLTRLSAMAALYDNFQVVSISFHFATSVSTSTDGAMLMAWDADPDDNYTSVTGDALNTYLDSTSCNVNFSTYRNAFLTVPGSKKLFVQQETGGDQRLVNHGRLWVATQGGVAPGTYGRILMKWRIKFMKPNLDPDNTTASYACSIVAPDGTYINAAHPFGDFSLILANTPLNVSPTYNPDIVTFSSLIPGTATPASVFIFKRAGKYRLIMQRIGIAIGVSAYTFTGASGCTFGGTGQTAAGYPYATTGLYAIVAGTTTTLGYVDVNASGGGYVYANGDSGPSHTSSVVTVISFPATDANPPPPLVSYEAQELQRLKFMLEKLMVPAKSPVPLVDNQTSTSTTTISTVQSPAGEPVRSWNSATSTTGFLGPVDVVVIPPPAGSTDTRHLGIATEMGSVNPSGTIVPKPRRLPFEMPPGYKTIPEYDGMKVEGVYPDVLDYPKLTCQKFGINWETYLDDRAAFFLQGIPYLDDSDVVHGLAQLTCTYTDEDCGRLSDRDFVHALLLDVCNYPPDGFGDDPNIPDVTPEAAEFWKSVANHQLARLMDPRNVRIRNTNLKKIVLYENALENFGKIPDKNCKDYSR